MSTRWKTGIAIAALMGIVVFVCLSVMPRPDSLRPRVIRPRRVEELPPDGRKVMCHVLFAVRGSAREVAVLSPYELECWLVADEFPVFECNSADAVPRRAFYARNVPLKLYRYRLPSSVVIENALYGPRGTAEEFYHGLVKPETVPGTSSD